MASNAARAAVPTLPTMRSIVNEERLLADVSAPAITLKDLRISTLASTDSAVKRRLRLSSNFLKLAGFEENTRFDARALGFEKGIELTYAPNGSHKIHVRTYGRRKANPLETQVDLQSQSLIDAAIPSYVEACRWEIQPGRIQIIPMANRVFSIGRSMRRRRLEERLEAFVALTGGCDVRLLEDHGFTVRGVLEFRPQEARDTSDRTETGALNALANGRNIRLLANQDIYKADWGRVAHHLQAVDGVVPMLHASLQCDDFSCLKDSKSRQASIENLTSTIDMVVPLLRGVDALMPAVVVIENVPGFITSQAGAILQLQLRRMGYQVDAAVLSSPDFGGLTLRRRTYIVASIWPGFVFPNATGRNTRPIHEVLAEDIPRMADVSDRSSVRKGLEGGRARIIRPGDTNAPTVTKSQPRGAKDSVLMEVDGRYRFIDGPASKRLMGLERVNTELLTSDLEAEVIGQSIEAPMHGALMDAIRRHILGCTGAPAIAVNAGLF